MVKKTQPHGTLRTGMGGWNFAPWRGVFYPEGLTQKRELEYASQHVTSIEINGTYYRAPAPEVYRQWAATVPDGFLFSVKAPRYIVQKKALAETKEQVSRFIEGAAALGDRLGPVLWQFLPTRTFDPGDIAAFLDLLPEKVDGMPLRHAVEVRHESFLDPRWLELARGRGVATVYTDSPDYPNLADLTGPFVYARLMRSQANRKTGYTAAALAEWATRAATWTSGGDPDDLPHVGQPQPRETPRDAFIYFISAAKERNPAAAMALGHAAGIA
ncbi:DUF72 domain-containing protein [Luteibacter aegosomatissinici]|uniref:DUF72 domain-containing protein n=1 Tax=Luteibacter aegosomatissinici TaxID=2911539 RepID=UPI001FF77627|nr:DUF72 domain-containing protein [Luteibacter aegosomatissinici]UPG94382.1 DUF72 domain-containing protein [Luteibacter aegosomatissinici]